MNKISRTGWFPWVSLLTGAVGFGLRRWQLSSVDSRGLLPPYHLAGFLSLFLLLLTAGITFWRLYRIPATKAYRRLFPASKLAAAGTAIGAVGLGVSAFMVKATGMLQILVPILGVLCAAALLYAAYCRLLGMRPNAFLHGAVAVYLIFRILTYCRIWGAESQVQVYLFPMLGMLFLLLACYFRGEIDAMIGDYRKYMFFSQLALFCSIMCLPGNDWPFYGTVALWLAADFCILPTHPDNA